VKKLIAIMVILLTMVSTQIVFADSGIVNTASLNIRKSPATSASIMGSLPKNAKINTLGKTGSFYKISYKGKNGYVYSSFIKLGNTTAKPVVNQNIPVLMYHKLTTDPKKTDSLTILKITFSSHMNYLKTHGYNTISLEQLSNYISKNSSLPKNPVVITFDDGYVSNYTMVYPILKANKQKATVFAIANNTDKYTPFLNSKQLKEMDANNFRVENHTYNHDNLASLSYANQLASITKSKQFLEKILGRKEVYIAYPFGSYNANTLKAAKAAGCTMGLTTEKGFTSKKDNLYKIHRIYVNSTDSLSILAKKLK